jgi:GNAT superfamily N-acetyltransferase
MSWTCRELSMDSPEYRASLALREEVLRRPLGLVWTAEELAKEEKSRHLGCFLDDELVGALVLTPEDESTVRMRLVAVAPGQQGRGVGSALVAHAEDVARRAGYRMMVARARETAVPFYRRHGYSVEMAVFMQVGIPHQVVRKELK